MGEPPPGPAEAFNEGEPSTPRPAGSVILLRRGAKHGERALEVLLLQRSHEAAFMPRAWVFPGGAVEPGDGEGEAGNARLRGARARGGGRDQPGAGAELILFSRWITPEFVKTRFDAWFFLALAPAAFPTAAGRLRDRRRRLVWPRAALDAHAAEELHLVFPTIKQLERLLPIRQLRGGDRGQPRTSRSSRSCRSSSAAADETRLVLPGDPGYPA